MGRDAVQLLRLLGGRGRGSYSLYGTGATEGEFLKHISPHLPTSPGWSPQRPLCQWREASAGGTAFISAEEGEEGACSALGEGARQAEALTWKVLDKGVVESVA